MKFTIADLRLPMVWAALLLLLSTLNFQRSTAWAYPPAPATQAQVDAGREPYLYVTPATLVNWSTNGSFVGGGTNIYNVAATNIVVSTDFVLDTSYTNNTSSNLWVSAMVFGGATIGAGLWIDQAADGTYETKRPFPRGVQTGGIVLSTNEVSGFVLPGGRFIFTNNGVIGVYILENTSQRVYSGIGAVTGTSSGGGGDITAASLTSGTNSFVGGTFTGNGVGLTNVNAHTLNADTAISRLAKTNNLFVFLGDSITKGTWNSNGWSLVDQASILPFFSGRGFITNAAISGTYCTNGITVFTNAIVPLIQSRAWDAVYVFTLFGANEMLSGTVTNSFTSVSNWVNYPNGSYWLLNSNIVGNGAIHIIETPTPYGAGGNSYVAFPIIAQMAWQLRNLTNASMVVSMHDVLPDPLDLNDFTPDFLHPNNYGSRKLARRLNDAMLGMDFNIPEKRGAIDLLQLNGNNANLLIGSSSLTQTKLHLSAATGSSSTALGLSIGAATGTRDMGVVAMIGTAGQVALGSAANDTIVAAKGGGRVVLATSVNTSTYQRDMVYVEPDGDFVVQSNAFFQCGIAYRSHTGAGITNTFPSYTGTLTNWVLFNQNGTPQWGCTNVANGGFIIRNAMP